MIGNIYGTVTERTYDLYEKSWNKYDTFCTENSFWEKSPKSVMEWRKSLIDQGFSPNTINSHLSAIKTIFKEAVASGEVTIETYTMVRAIGSVSVRALRDRLRPSKDRLSDETVMVIINAIDNSTLKGLRDRAILSVLATTGVRVDELSSLNISQWDSTRKIISVRGKTDTVPRNVPMSDLAKQAVALWLMARNSDAFCIFNGFEGRSGRLRSVPVTTQGVYNMVVERASVVGIDVTPHDFRRYVATRLAEKNIVEAQQVLGHRSIVTTQRYIKQLALPDVDWLK